MAKREKILLFGALLAALFGAFQLLRPGPELVPPPRSSAGSDQAGDFVEKVKAELLAHALSETENQLMARVNLEWADDPFVGKKLVPPNEAKGAEDLNAQELAYTGYVISGATRLAIINGLEYQVGDELVMGGFIVRGISPDAVILESAGMPRNVTVPFVGE